MNKIGPSRKVPCKGCLYVAHVSGWYSLSKKDKLRYTNPTGRLINRPFKKNGIGKLNSNISRCMTPANQCQIQIITQKLTTSCTSFPYVANVSKHCYIRIQPKSQLCPGTEPLKRKCLQAQFHHWLVWMSSIRSQRTTRLNRQEAPLCQRQQSTQTKRLPSHMDKAETDNCQVEKITITESHTHPHKAHSKSVTPTIQYKPTSKGKTTHRNPTRALQPTHRIACNNLSTDSRTVI